MKTFVSLILLLIINLCCYAENNWREVERFLSLNNNYSVSVWGRDKKRNELEIGFYKNNSGTIDVKTAFNNKTLYCNKFGVKKTTYGDVYLFIHAPETNPNVQFFIWDDEACPNVQYEDASGGELLQWEAELIVVKNKNSEVVYVWSSNASNPENRGNGKLNKIFDYLTKGIYRL